MLIFFRFDKDLVSEATFYIMWIVVEAYHELVFSNCMISIN
jgi:hypothetical protein